ncbi:hypothetical protein GCM10009739_07100 [Microbacterium ulmi]
MARTPSGEQQREACERDDHGRRDGRDDGRPPSRRCGDARSGDPLGEASGQEGPADDVADAMGEARDRADGDDEGDQAEEPDHVAGQGTRRERDDRDARGDRQRDMPAREGVRGEARVVEVPGADEHDVAQKRVQKRDHEDRRGRRERGGDPPGDERAQDRDAGAEQAQQQHGCACGTQRHRPRAHPLVKPEAHLVESLPDRSQHGERVHGREGDREQGAANGSRAHPGHVGGAARPGPARRRRADDRSSRPIASPVTAASRVGRNLSVARMR